MSRLSLTFRLFVTTIAAVVFSLTTCGEASAQGYISPFMGYNFSGDAGCPEITDCEDKNLNWGASLGVVGGLFGTELDLGYVNDFFGESDSYESNVLTLMGNLLLAPRFGPVQPYGLFGLGLIRTSTDLTPQGLDDESNNDFGWNWGGGVFGYFSQHIGVRGDVRFFYTFDAREVLGFEGSDEKLDFGRVSGALVIRF
jgi:opacity protein-like surface antigen